MDNTENNAVPAKLHVKRLGRELAMQFLFSCEMQNTVPGAEQFDIFFEALLNEYKVNANRNFRKSGEYARELYTLVVLHQDELDSKLSVKCVNWEWSRVSPVERNILRVALAEMLYLDDVPLVVSIDEAVGIARDFSGVEAGNFINGVLNSIKDNEFSGN